MSWISVLLGAGVIVFFVLIAALLTMSQGQKSSDNEKDE